MPKKKRSSIGRIPKNTRQRRGDIADIPEDMMPYGTSIVGGGTAFLTHEPLASAMAGYRPKTVCGVDPGLMRSRTVAGDNRMRMALHYSPFLFRRTVTSLGELPPLPSPFSRSKSARHPGREIIMPRSHVSVARFYDWTEDIGDCYSVSSLYRDIASIPKSQGSKSRINLTMNTGNGPLVVGGPSRVAVTSPGRMFVRDKKSLTRGEREIIEGIYKNRSDLNPKDTVTKADLDVKSHTEAWCAGKTFARGERVNGKKIVTMPGTEERVLIKSGSSSDETSSSLDAGSGQSRRLIHAKSRPPGHGGNRKFPDLSPRVNCAKCQYTPREVNHDLAKRTLQTQSQDGYWDLRPEAPPSTPDNQQNISHRLQPAFDKLIGSIPSNQNSSSASSASASLSSKTPKTAAHSSPHKDLAVLSLSSSSSSSAKPKTNFPKTETNKIQKTLDVIYSVLEEDTKRASRPEDNEQFSRISTPESPTSGDLKEDSGLSSNHDDEHEGESSDGETKRVKVRVYLPTAQNDQFVDDDDLESIASSTVRLQLTKERPLSHNEFHSTKTKPQA